MKIDLFRHRILAIDPGSIIAGYSCIGTTNDRPILPREFSIISAGALRVDGKLPHYKRIGELHRTIRQDNVNVRIYNSVGTLVHSSNFTGSSKAIDVSKLSNGIYFIRLEGNKKIITDRFIKR